jgi:hypothetical protein
MSRGPLEESPRAFAGKAEVTNTVKANTTVKQRRNGCAIMLSRDG